MQKHGRGLAAGWDRICTNPSISFISFAVAIANACMQPPRDKPKDKEAWEERNNPNHSIWCVVYFRVVVDLKPALFMHLLTYREKSPETLLES